MSDRFKFLIGLALFGLLGVSGIHLVGTAKLAERQIIKNAERVLIETGHEWAEISVTGQKVVLSGTAPSQDAVTKTQDALRQALGAGGLIIGGITHVSAHDITIDETLATSVAPDALFTEPFAWSVDHRDSRIIVSGHIPSEEAKELILAAIVRQFPNTTIVSDMVVGATPNANQWTVAAMSSLTALSTLDIGNVSATRSSFLIEGSTNIRTRTQTVEILMANLPQPISGSANVELIVPDPEEDRNTNEDEREDSIAPSSDTLTETASTTIADANACQANVDTAMSGKLINFAIGQSAITEESRVTLEEISEVLKQCDGIHIQIEGHTDSSGNARRNLRLSEQRAEAVKSFFIASGLDETTLSAVGFGATSPVASNETSVGRALNRRIKFTVTARDAEQHQIENQ